MSDRADHLATHLLNGAKHVLNPGPGLGDPVVATLLGFRQRFVGLAFALDLVAVFLLLEELISGLGGIASICVDIRTGVEGIHDIIEMITITDTGGVGPDLADHLVLLVDIH